MTKPLALVFYERLLPGSQLVNRLNDLGYRVASHTDASRLVESVRKEMPMVMLVDLACKKVDINAVVKVIKGDSTVSHIPILGFVDKKNSQLQKPAIEAGVTIVALDEGISHQLPQLLEQALEVQ